MKKKLIVVTALLLAAVTLLVTVGCSSADREIKSLIKKYEKACNELDFDEVLDCLDPAISEKISLAVGFIGLFTDAEPSELFAKVAEFLSANSFGGTDFFSSMKISVNEIKVDGSKAVVSATVHYKVAGSELSDDFAFHCVYKDDEWYISSVSLI